MNFESHVVPVACIAVEKLRKRGCYQGTSRGLYVLLSFFFIIRPFFSLQFGAKDKWNNVMCHGFVVLELESLFTGKSLVHQES